MTTENVTPRDERPPLIAPPAEPEPVADIVSPAEEPPVDDEPVSSSEREYVGTSDSGPLGTSEPDHLAASEPKIVYVSAPTPPRAQGARGTGAAVVLLSTVIFAALYAAIIVLLALTLRADGLNGITDYLATSPYWLPVVVFGFAHLLLVVLVNRGGWWAHVLGGFLVAVVVWLGFIGAALIASGTIGGTSADQQAVFLQQLVNPLGVVAAILAREIPIWVGGIIARRGRTVAKRNAQARETYEKDLAEHRASTTAQEGTTAR
jgi:hypothetical protein